MNFSNVNIWGWILVILWVIEIGYRFIKYGQTEERHYGWEYMMGVLLPTFLTFKALGIL